MDVLASKECKEPCMDLQGHVRGVRLYIRLYLDAGLGWFVVFVGVVDVIGDAIVEDVDGGCGCCRSG